MNNSSDSKETRDHTVAHTRCVMNVCQTNEQMRLGEPAGGPGSSAEEGPLPRDRPTSQGWGGERKPGPRPEAPAFPEAPLSLSRSFNLKYGRELAVNGLRMLQGGTAAEPAGRGDDHWMNEGGLLPRSYCPEGSPSVNWLAFLPGGHRSKATKSSEPPGAM